MKTNKKSERVTRATERAVYAWINPAERAAAEKQIPDDVVAELRATRTMGDWYRIARRISDELWAGATDAEIDNAIRDCEAELDRVCA